MTLMIAMVVAMAMMIATEVAMIVMIAMVAGVYLFWFTCQPKCTLTSLAIESPKQTQSSYQPAGPVSWKSYWPKAKVTRLWPAGGYYVQPCVVVTMNDYGDADYFSAKGVCSVHPVGLRQKH